MNLSRRCQDLKDPCRGPARAALFELTSTRCDVKRNRFIARFDPTRGSTDPVRLNSRNFDDWFEGFDSEWPRLIHPAAGELNHKASVGTAIGFADFFNRQADG